MRYHIYSIGYMLWWCAAMSIIMKMIGARELIARARKRSSRASVAAAITAAITAQVMMWALRLWKNLQLPYSNTHASEAEIKFLTTLKFEICW